AKGGRRIGGRRPPEATDRARRTRSGSQTGAPSGAATAPATAASATGPRKNSPGVKISPIASSTAAITHASQAIRSEPTEAQRRRQRVEVVDPRLELGVATEPVEQDRAHSEGPRTADVALGGLAHHRRLVG